MRGIAFKFIRGKWNHKTGNELHMKKGGSGEIGTPKQLYMFC